LDNADFAPLSRPVNQLPPIGVVPPTHFPEDHVVDDTYNGSEAAASRAVSRALFFDSVDHEKMMRNYAERRSSAGLSTVLFRSIRPGFPWYNEEDQ